ncbi:hypothetical protein HDU98_003837 [Podochytrium sp. JEL0797]|nr:hypothetical protein HDU98_003837 [Podochytrium sp. JEL0797]
MFRSLLLRQAQTPKASTLLAGIPAHANARAELTSLYQRVLHSATRLPSSSVYRQAVEATHHSRLAVVAANESVAQIEKEIDGGQIEELLIQAEDELRLIKAMQDAEPWLPLEVKAPEGQWTSPLV